jgi:hypothetical protein
MRTRVAILCCAALIAAVAGAAERRNQRLREYRHKAIGKPALARAAVGAGVNQLRNSPREWGGGLGGFGKRFASGLGQHVVKETIQFGVGAWHHENLRYQRSNLQGTWPRLGYAVKSTFIVPRTNRPGKTVALGRISGNLGAGVISRAWLPASAGGIGAGFASGGIGLGAEVGFHVAREFWPRKQLKRPIRRRTRN